MNQKIRKIESQKSVKAAKVEETNNFMANKVQLVKDFGTNKAKKQISNMKSNMISDDNISSVTAMNEMLSKTAMHQEKNLRSNPEEQLDAKIENLREILPQFDNTTTDVTSIFEQDTSKGYL